MQCRALDQSLVVHSLPCTVTGIKVILTLASWRDRNIVFMNFLGQIERETWLWQERNKMSISRKNDHYILKKHFLPYTKYFKTFVEDFSIVQCL